ncbi:hypothetical protein Taro_040166 [Colocasia esculenta]|uniref:Uncharacterized protein n=1 Tax=Colocasia esculenta TaxID=4460 RepID=A0A843WTN7_COLES|nr:hypothetical protein [Colocasia esculenta]
MASRLAPAALLLAALALLAVGGAAARPCKTLFVSYIFSSDASEGAALEVSQISAAGDQTPPRFFAIYRMIPLRFYRHRSYSISSAAATEPLAATLRLPAGIERPSLPRPIVRAEPSFGVSSLRERARDILVVVAGLLFGVGCAAVTSAAVYLAWYLVNNRYEVCGSEGYEYIDDEDDAVKSPKKMGYSDLPAMPASPVSPLKEGSGGN